jgi:hypothetical protein
MEIQRVSLDSLHADPANANVHPEEDIRGLMAKLAAFEQVEPLVVQARTRKVIGGNGRLEAMRRLGWAECDVHLVDVDNVTATAMAIALNTRKSELDDRIIAQQVEALRSDGWDDFEAIGLDDADLDAILPEVEDAAPGADDDGPDGVRQDDPGDAEESGEPDDEPEAAAPPGFTGVLRYELIFDDVDQQARWFKFIRWLKSQGDLEADTVAGRLDKFLAAYGPAELLA